MKYLAGKYRNETIINIKNVEYDTLLADTPVASRI